MKIKYIKSFVLDGNQTPNGLVVKINTRPIRYSKLKSVI